MKYSLSKIMRNAWNSYRAEKRERSYHGLPMIKSFGYFLKMAWMGAKNEMKLAKRAAERQAELAKIAENKKDFSGKTSFEGYFFRIWENYGKRRIYIGNNGAYIDIDDNNKIHSRNPEIIRVAEMFLATHNI